MLPATREANLVKATVIKEAAATFSPEPGSDRWRPPQRTPLPNLYLAGDWTQTGWPATMEGAVRSGYLAAEAILAAAGAPRQLVRPDLPPEGLARWLASPAPACSADYFCTLALFLRLQTRFRVSLSFPPEVPFGAEVYAAGLHGVRRPEEERETSTGTSAAPGTDRAAHPAHGRHHHARALLELRRGAADRRRSADQVPACAFELHSCKQCVHFDTGAQFECTQPISERIAHKDARNECTFYAFRMTIEKDTAPTTASRAGAAAPRRNFRRRPSQQRAQSLRRPLQEIAATQRTTGAGSGTESVPRPGRRQRHRVADSAGEADRARGSSLRRAS